MLNRVLVVEDDPITCELIQEVLSSAEIEAHAVTDSTRQRHDSRRTNSMRPFWMCACRRPMASSWRGRFVRPV
jgi:DNA-binding NtrC family response regulator